MKEHGITPIDLVIINLYPFQQTVAKPDVTFADDAIENIDIGGPSMVRSASKNHAYVLIVTSPANYEEVLAELRANKGCSTYATRLRMAQKAFSHTSAYDAAIATYLSKQVASQAGTPADAMPSTLNIALTKKQELRYGENPHQKAALYVGAKPSEPSVAFATQHHGKELSYINLLDADGALLAARELPSPAACIVKHATPCGFATGTDLKTAFEKAYAGDPVAAFGGIIALNRPVDLATRPGDDLRRRWQVVPRSDGRAELCT